MIDGRQEERRRKLIWLSWYKKLKKGLEYLERMTKGRNTKNTKGKREIIIDSEDGRM